MSAEIDEQEKEWEQLIAGPVVGDDENDLKKSSITKCSPTTYCPPTLFQHFPDKAIASPSLLVDNRKLLEVLFFGSDDEDSSSEFESKFITFHKILIKLVANFASLVQGQQTKKKVVETELDFSPLNKATTTHDYDIFIYNALARLFLPKKEVYNRSNHAKTYLMLEAAIYLFNNLVTKEQKMNFQLLLGAKEGTSPIEMVITIINSYKITMLHIQRNAIDRFKIDDIFDIFLFEYACLSVLGPLSDFRKNLQIGEEFGGQTGYPCLDALVEAGYHNLRASRDTASPDCLYVCLMSMDYLLHILRHHIVEKIEKGTTWFKIIVYFPFSHNKTEAPIHFFAPKLIDFFHSVFSQDYRDLAVMEVSLPETDVGMKARFKETFPTAQISNNARHYLNEIHSTLSPERSKRSRN